MSTGKKRGLGRGLSALFGDEKPKDKPQVINKSNTVSISDLSRNPYQPRQHFSEQKLEELANSIKQNGVIQPIAVRQSKSDINKYEIVAGERRWLAAQRAGLHEIPVNILELSDLESLEVAIVENIQRDDLTPIEEARGYKRLFDEFKYDHEDISKLMSKSRSHISNTLRLLNLPKDVIAMIEERSLTSGQARPLVGLANASSIAEEIVAKNYSARKVEYLVKGKKVSKNKKKQL
jgi:ParB family chromosome partitioning protein